MKTVPLFVASSVFEFLSSRLILLFRSFTSFALLIPLGLTFVFPSAEAQTDGGAPEWAWMGGNNTVPAGKGQPGVYGTEYQFAPTNTPGGRIWGALSWTDQVGRLWLFGGFGYDASGTAGYLGDMWVFDPSQGASGEWAWMGGSSTLSTNSVGYTGQTGVYGTEYQFAPSNVPGGRQFAINWTDASGKFWLFGGEGFDSAGNAGYLSDLWVFDPSQGANGEWAWMGGSNTAPKAQFACDQPANYGTEYQFADSNNPGHRAGSTTWADQRGRLWLFGDAGCEFAGSPAVMMNDLWVFDPSQGAHGEWVWMGGSNAAYANGAYGTEYQFAASNAPGARDSASGWTDTNGRLWLFGGYGYDSAGTRNNLNDLWVFDPTQGANGEWAWMGGSEIARAIPIYGTEYQFADSNAPGSRDEAMSWTDKSGKFWLFGGVGSDSLGDYGYLNDLWVFDPSQSAHGEWAWMGGSSTFPSGSGDSGVYGTEFQYAASNAPGGRNTGATWVDPSGKLWLFGGEGYDSQGNNGMLNDLWELKVPSTTMPAKLTSPTPGSTLSGARATFNWTAETGSTRYVLYVGSTAGGRDITSLQTSSLSAAVSNLPLDGRRIYVTLYGNGGGSTTVQDTAIYTAATITSAVITGPAKGSTLSGATATFNWTAETGSTRYVLYVGSTPGGRDITSVQTGGLAAVVSNLPVDGRQIYATLYGNGGGSTTVQDTATYTAATVTSAVITGPAKGSTLPGAGAMFNWTAETGATLYVLYVGSTPGARDITSLRTSNLSATVSNLPVDGRQIYVTLYGNGGGSTTVQDTAIYTAATVTSAVITGPTKGSTLSGARATFNWTAETGAALYVLYVGSTPGARDITSLRTGNLSATVSNLPADGRQIYVTLYGNSGGSTTVQDTAAYTAF